MPTHDQRPSALVRSATRELRRLRGRPIVGLELDADSVLALISSMQVAFRHPDFPPWTRATAEPIARGLEGSLAAFPALAAMAAAGWKPDQEEEEQSEGVTEGVTSDVAEPCERCRQMIPPAILDCPYQTEDKRRNTKVIRFDSGPIVIERDGFTYHYCRDCAADLAICIECGCTHEVPCEDKNGGTCSWVPGEICLCTACVKPRRRVPSRKKR